MCLSSNALYSLSYYIGFITLLQDKTIREGQTLLKLQVKFDLIDKSDYIIPIPGPPPIGIAGSSDFISATTASVVNNVEATDVAF